MWYWYYSISSGVAWNTQWGVLKIWHMSYLVIVFYFFLIKLEKLEAQVEKICMDWFPNTDFKRSRELKHASVETLS